MMEVSVYDECCHCFYIYKKKEARFYIPSLLLYKRKVGHPRILNWLTDEKLKAKINIE